MAVFEILEKIGCHIGRRNKCSGIGCLVQPNPDKTIIYLGLFVAMKSLGVKSFYRCSRAVFTADTYSRAKFVSR